jgi:hypothetical protein
VNKDFVEHIEALEKTATESVDGERRDEAVRSLAIIALLMGGWKP